MTDTLRDKIVKTTWVTHRNHQLAQIGLPPSNPPVGIPTPDWAYAIADAVIRDVLTPEFSSDAGTHG